MRNAFVVIWLLFATAKAFPLQIVKSDQLPPDTLIVMQRGACEKRCVVYSVTIFSDGSVIYDGRYFVRRHGLIRSDITRETLGRLLEEVKAAGFFGLRDDYGYKTSSVCDSMRTQEGSVILTIANSGMSKTVLHYLGCASKESEVLRVLEDKVDRAVGSGKWIK